MSDLEAEAPETSPTSPDRAPQRPLAPGTKVVGQHRRLPGGRISAPIWEPPQFGEFHIAQLRRLGLDDDAIEAMRDEIDRESSHAATQLARGERAVRRAEQRAKDRAKQALQNADSAQTKDEVQRRFEALHLHIPDLGESSVASSLHALFHRRSVPLLTALRNQLEAENEYRTVRRTMADRTASYSATDLTAAKMGLEIAEEKVHAEEQAFREFLRKYDSEEMRERIAALDELLPGLSHSDFEQELIPLVVEAGEAFDSFRAVVRRIQVFVEERQRKLHEARSAERGLGLTGEHSVLPDPSRSLLDSYLTVAMRAVGARTHADDILDFVTGIKNPAVKGIGHPLR